MGRGRSRYLSYTALVLLARVSTASAGLWDVDIDESPAPPPDKGPPFSANASRNLDLLPYQIIGVVGAYIGSVLIIGSLLLTVGRNLRKRALNMAAEPREMVKPLSKTFERSPTSPNSSRNWYSPRRLREKRSTASSMHSPNEQVSPGMESVASFDTTVIEADRMKRQQEMERLYAAVMAQDSQRPMAQQSTKAMPPMTPLTPDMPPEYSRRNPPRLITDETGLRHLRAANAYPTTPITPKSPVRAIYPPDSSLPAGPISPTSPIRAQYPTWAKPAHLDPEQSHSRAPSYGSGHTATSGASAPTNKKFRKSIRNLKISAPIIRADDNSDGARTPLSPRYYANPGVPPEPPTAGTQHSAYYPPTTPGTARTYRTDDGWSDKVEEDVDEVRDLPHPNPQRVTAHNYLNEAQMVTNNASTRPDPTRSRAVGNGTLPFREMNRQYAQQRQAQQIHTQPYPQSPAKQSAAFPLSPGNWNPLSPSHAYATSAGPVKTTFLEARRDRLGGPKTGVPTPYSAYMPFTPVTPVTPHLTSRAERKQRQKEDKKARRAITEDDAVAEEDDLWSYAY